ncbi:YaaR family protein [Paenibacillus sp. HN-1]|uniref:YaaR family protein n=1 Tax=Paenibacillus TaxID=44249 RepID=UPI001CA8B1E9|nr:MULTISPECIES: YaaR family protein [Paenibacillus]MBY9082590.1 YaaR family protein [Paenibacillus sp. CGMCC 1.18879]MBY9085342.1 YaaR family protein [Paenibacillus sinensis]
MKINPGFRPIKSDLPVTDNTKQPVQRKTFSDMLQQNGEHASRDELMRKIQDIQVQGDRLSKSMTVRELTIYRTMIKRFLEETARRGVSLKETKGWDRRGRGKRYKLLEEIDSALLSMADELLDSEEGRIELLGKVGEIRGLLINLSF